MFGLVDFKKDREKWVKKQGRQWVEGAGGEGECLFPNGLQIYSNLLYSTKDFGAKWVENEHSILLVAFYYVLLTFFFGWGKFSIDIWN